MHLFASGSSTSKMLAIDSNQFALVLWINEQIVEDLSDNRPFSKKDLRILFQNYNRTGQQALYCSIHRNRVTWKSSDRSDGWRNPHIFAYFEQLSHRHRLPDTEFILLTDDGANNSQPLPVFAFSKMCGVRNVCLFPDFEMLWELTVLIRRDIQIFVHGR